MDFLIPLPFVIAGVLAALGVGYLFALVTTDNRHRKIAAERETQIQQEYSDYKRDVSEHFSQSSKLFSQVTDQYRQLYHHMADGAQLLGGTPPTPMIERLERERASSRRPRTEPQLLEGGLDDALVELRDDLHQFTTRLESRRQKTKANAKLLAERAAQPKPVTAQPSPAPAPVETSTQAGSKTDSVSAPRARHRSARSGNDQESALTPASAAPIAAQNRVRSQAGRTSQTTGADPAPLLDTGTLRTSTAAKALDDEAVKWQKLVDEWNPNGARITV